MKGKLFAVGVGPGDPELLTLKAVRILKEADIIACPTKNGEPGIAYRIAESAVPEIRSKKKLVLDFPMERSGYEEAHRKAADEIVQGLDAGMNTAFVTLGDPGIFSTFYYIAQEAGRKGFQTEIICGIPSFCAAAARLKIPLTLGAENVIITSGEYIDHDGPLVIMKAGMNLDGIKNEVKKAGKNVWFAENCGMEGEKLYAGLENIPDKAGYFSIMIVR